jgi:rSAM/selenodomain-associated transferase 1
MPRMANETALIVFARAPRPGTVKTRLVPLLGAAGAAALHARLVRRTLATARASGLQPLELHCAPDTEHPFLRACGVRYGAALVPQAAGDLGARMSRALQRALLGSRAAVLIGTDCPVLAVRHLRAAREALAAGNRAVFAPAEDGGYALIGLTQSDPRLFEDVPWGTAEVMAITRERLAGLGWRWHELETLWDIDRPEDYRRLLTTDMSGRQGAP